MLSTMLADIPAAVASYDK